MRNPHGYATWTDPDRPVIERDTVTCAHCSAVIFVKPNTASTVYIVWNEREKRWTEEPGAGCYMCGQGKAPICLPCCADGRCIPLERRLEESEKRGRS